MKKIILPLILILFSIGLFSQTKELTWEFTNVAVATATGVPIEVTFDVEISSVIPTDFSSCVLQFTFNQEALGADTYSVGSYFPLSDWSAATAVNGNKLTFDLFNKSFGTIELTSTPVVLCTFTMDINDFCLEGGIEFFKTGMFGKSVYLESGPRKYTNVFIAEPDFSFGYEPETTTWTGDINSDWDNSGNWTDCVPGATSSAIIPATSNAPIANVDVEVNDLTIEPNGNLTVPSPFTITVNNDLLIVSDASGTGSLIHNNQLSGVVQRNLKGWGGYTGDLKNGHGWHLLSSPVASQAILPFQDLTDNDDFMKWYEPDNVWKNRRQAGGSIIPTPGFDTEFDLGIGYLVAYEADKDFTFEGVLNTADVPVIGLTNNDPEPIHSNYYGYHQLGNPYASALTWNNNVAAWNLFNVANIAQIWKEGDASYATIEQGDPIPAMQGFFVYTDLGSGSLTIPASQRVHDATPYYKDAPQQIVLSARDLDHQMKQESKIAFNPDATVGFDMKYDSYFMGGYAPQFYSVSNGAAFALNTLPTMTEELVIPFTFVKNEGTNFKITLDAALDYGTIYLVDSKTNVTVNLSQTGSYSFVAAEGDDVNRFLLKFGAVGINDLVANEAAIEIFSAGDVLYLNALKSGDATVSVFDLLGRTVLTTAVHMSPSATVDVSRLSGTYIVRAIANGEVVSAKVFIR